MKKIFDFVSGYRNQIIVNILALAWLVGTIGAILFLELHSKEPSAPILSAIAWPLVAVVAVLAFKQPIHQLLQEIVELKTGGLEAKFQKPLGRGTKLSEDTKSPQNREIGEWGSKIEPSAFGHMFWLGSDLFELMDGLLKGNDRDFITRGLRQSNHHLKKIGFAESPPQRRLAKILTSARESLNTDWTDAKRLETAREIWSIRDDIARIIEAATKPAFQGDAKE